MSTSGSSHPFPQRLIYVPTLAFWRRRRGGVVVVITRSRSGAPSGRCTCWRFARYRICRHVLVVAVMLAKAFRRAPRGRAK
jgi:hypothetical protein